MPCSASCARRWSRSSSPALLAICALLADGHLLIEDVPGVGKTTLARVVARAIGGHDARIQCTGDLSAEDVVGRLIPSDGFRDETFERGPIFANAVVFDEFNRATPRVQSALLAAMEERVVTAGKQRHALPRPFFAVGTMNPHDNSGTFELGFAQRDRFAIRTGLGYASARGEVDLIDRFSAFDVTAEIDPIIAPGDLVKLQRAVGARARPRAASRPTWSTSSAPPATIRTSWSGPRRARSSRPSAAARR